MFTDVFFSSPKAPLLHLLPSPHHRPLNPNPTAHTAPQLRSPRARPHGAPHLPRQPPPGRDRHRRRRGREGRRGGGVAAPGSGLWPARRPQRRVRSCVGVKFAAVWDGLRFHHPARSDLDSSGRPTAVDVDRIRCQSVSAGCACCIGGCLIYCISNMHSYGGPLGL